MIGFLVDCVTVFYKSLIGGLAVTVGTLAVLFAAGLIKYMFEKK